MCTQCLLTWPLTTHDAYPTPDRYHNGFPVLGSLGEALNEKYEPRSTYSLSDLSSSNVGSSSNPHHPIPSDYETEWFLHKHLNIPKLMPLSLDAIAHENKPGIKTMILLSIWASPEKHLTLQGIYKAIETRFPHCKFANDKPWQVSGIFYQQIHVILIDLLPEIHPTQPLP
jgi:hypothetical protein